MDELELDPALLEPVPLEPVPLEPVLLEPVPLEPVPLEPVPLEPVPLLPELTLMRAGHRSPSCCRRRPSGPGEMSRVTTVPATGEVSVASFRLVCGLGQVHLVGGHRSLVGGH